ncbi:MAG: redoxin domain-containing protein [Bacteroidales bacterium]|nr:redoxin domain-containing protein [Bacteroidales bacterium]
MKNYIKYPLLLLSACFSVLHSQAQYNITFDAKNSKDDTLILCYYHLDNSYALDTAVNKKGRFVFKGEAKVHDGVYLLINTSKQVLFEFVLDNENKLHFIAGGDNWKENLKCKNSKKEQVYLDYYVQSEALTDSVKQLMKQKNTLTKQQYEDKFSLLRQKNDSLKENFIAKNPDHLFSKILLCSKPVEIPAMDTVYREDGSVDTLAMQYKAYYWLKNHYFDNVDLSCGGLLYTPKDVFFRTYSLYFDDVLKYEKTDSLSKYACQLIDSAKNEAVFNYFVRNLGNRFLTDGYMGHEKVYIDIVDRYIRSGKYKDMQPSDVQMNLERSDKWRKLLIGKQIPDLACPETDDKSLWHHLDELKTKYKFLVFWSVECGHCTTEIPKLSEFYNQYKDVYGFEVFAVHTEGEIEKMQEFAKQHDIKWINTNGLYANYDWREYFDIEKTPVIYILDSQDVIKAKNISVSSLKQVMDILENGGFDR